MKYSAEDTSTSLEQAFETAHNTSSKERALPCGPLDILNRMHLLQHIALLHYLRPALESTLTCGKPIYVVLPYYVNPAWC